MCLVSLHAAQPSLNLPDSVPAIRQRGLRLDPASDNTSPSIIALEGIWEADLRP